jgi:hypothetical protein
LDILSDTHAAYDAGREDDVCYLEGKSRKMPCCGATQTRIS